MLAFYARTLKFALGHPLSTVTGLFAVIAVEFGGFLLFARWMSRPVKPLD